MSSKKTKPSDKPVNTMNAEELLLALEAEKAKNAELEKTNHEQADLVDELSKSVTAAGKGLKQKPVVKHDGVSYEVVSKSFSYEGKVIAGESLTKNKELVAKLVEMKSGHLKAID